MKRLPSGPAVVIALALAWFAGCSSPDTGAQRPSASAAGSPSSSSSVPIAVHSDPPPNQLGDTVRTFRRGLMTVFSWRRDPRPGPAADGSFWAADVRFCAPPDLTQRVPVGTVRGAFRVELANGDDLTAESDARKPSEVYGEHRILTAGTCLRGDVVFDVPTGARVKDFELATGFGSLRWRVPRRH